MARRPIDPFGGNMFLVETGGMTQAAFSEVTGIKGTFEAVEYRNGNEDFTPRKMPGLKKFDNVTLKRGVLIGQDLFDWFKTVTDGIIERRDISIVLLDEARTEQVRYNLTQAWPCTFIAPELKANANEIAVESLEICHEGISVS